MSNTGCSLSGECEFAGICQSNDSSLIMDAIQSSPEVAILGPELETEELVFLAKPVLEAWNRDTCLKERVRALKELQFDEGISHVSITMGSSVLGRIDELLGVS